MFSERVHQNMSTGTSSHRAAVEDLTRAIMEAYNNGEPERLDGFLTDDFVCHLAGGGVVDGPEAYKQRIHSIRAAFPDFWKTQEFLAVDGDRAAVQYRWGGTHEGEFMGVPPTGNEVETTSAVLLRLEGDRLAEMWLYSDGQSLMQQLGVEQ